MTFQKSIPVNITGPSYQSRSRPLSSQQTKNFYHEVVEEGKDNYVLHSWPGLKTISTAPVVGIDRGMENMDEVGFRVVGNKLYSFDSLGVHTELGDIPGTDRCIFSNDGINLIIVSGNVPYIYDGTTVSLIEDSNIVGSTAVTFLNNQMIYTNPPLFVIADPGIPNLASGLNAAQAESQPDSLVRAYAFQQSAYMIGLRSTEPWWNSGVGNPPMERIDGQIFEVGCAAIHSVDHTDDFLYWLGDDGAVYQASGGNKTRVSSSAISNAISGYGTVNDAVGYTVTIDGINFYIITFPTENRTWCLNEFLGKKGWLELSSGTNGDKYQGSSLINIYGKNFVADETNGKLYELNLNTFTNNDEIIQRRRITSSVNGKVLGKPGDLVQMSRLEIMMEQGVGLITGQGENPKIMIEISLDGSRSWAEKGFVRIGRLGEHTLRVELYLLDTFLDAIFRITTSDPVPYEIYSAAIDLRLAGR